MCTRVQLEDWVRAVVLQDGCTELDCWIELVRSALNHVKSTFPEEYARSSDILRAAAFCDERITHYRQFRGPGFPTGNHIPDIGNTPLREYLGRILGPNDILNVLTNDQVESV